MQVKIFTKKTCPKCPAAKELSLELGKKGQNVSLYDLEDPDGLAEAAMYNVMATPTIIITDDSGNEEKSFRGTVPKIKEISEAK